MKVNSHLEDFIYKLYQQINVRKPAELNIKTISNAMDIKIFYWERTSEAISYDDMTAIFIDSRINNQLQWQDFGHELCHPLLHAGDQFNMPPLFREYQEFKANNFMYHACIPTFMLDELEIMDCTPQTIHRIRQLFNVEYEFARARLVKYISKKYFVLNSNI